MSLHDYIVVDLLLPDLGHVDWSFQTTSLDNSLSNYRILGSKQLYEMPYDEAGHGRKLYRPNDVSFHQDIFIYTAREDEWWEYRIRFTNGFVIEIARIEKGSVWLNEK